MDVKKTSPIPDDWTVGSIDKVIEKTQHNRPPYTVVRLLKANKNPDSGLQWLRGGDLDDSEGANQGPVWISFDLIDPELPDDAQRFVKVGNTWKEVETGKVIKGGVTMVLRNHGYTVATGWKAADAVTYGAEHESDPELGLTQDEKQSLRQKKQQNGDKHNV